jgi:hypothetical protein
MRKNVNPKSLKGNDQLDRVRELMGKMQPLNESTSLSELELIKKGPNNVIYGIVRENHKYFIKTTNKTSGRIVAEDFDYIGGLQNKFSEAYNSYAAVTKQLNLKFDMLNESLGIDTHNNILESDGVAFGGGAGFGFVVEEEENEPKDEKEKEDSKDEKEKEDSKDKSRGEKELDTISNKNLDLDKHLEEEVVEEQWEEDEDFGDEEKLEEKTVLKVDAPAPAEPEMEEPIEDEVPMEDDMEEEPAMDMEEEPAMDDEGDDEEDSTKKIQKLTGKIGQAIRELDEPDAELEKYVINSIISALHLDEFSDEDIEDIISKLEGEEEEDEAEAGEMDMEEPSMEEEPAEEEVEEEEMEVAESVTYTKSQLVESLTKKLVKESIEEHHMGKKRPTYTKYPEYDGAAYKIMEEDDSMYVDCPECMGEGCSHCDDLGYHLSNDFDSEPELHGDSAVGTFKLPADDFMALDTETGRQRPTDRDGNEIPNDIDSYQQPNKYDDEMLDENDGYEVDVFDAIADIDGTFDKDGNGVSDKIDTYQKPSRGGEVDIMNYFNDNSRKRDNMGYDIEYFNSKSDVRGGDTTTKPKPKTKDPIVKPGGPWTTPSTIPDEQTVPKAGNKNPKYKEEPKRSFRRIGGYRK